MVDLPDLNFPAYQPNLRQEGCQPYIFDPIRKKYLLLTPEEWVRQHLINYLSTALNYPKSLMRSEMGLKYNKLARRSDLLVYSPHKTAPLLLAECKAPRVGLSQATLEQAVAYNHTLQASIILLTNGLKLICFAQQEGKWIALPQVPDYKTASAHYVR